MAAIADFNIGRDVQIVLMMGALGRLDLQKVSDFSSKPVTNTVQIKPLNEPGIGRYLPSHWEGEISMDRANSVADDAMATLEAAFWNGLRLPTGTMYTYVNEVDGSVSTYQYDEVSITLSDAGSASADAPLKQTIAWMARRRRKV
jgi:hypothetical protein